MFARTFNDTQERICFTLYVYANNKIESTTLSQILFNKKSPCSNQRELVNANESVLKSASLVLFYFLKDKNFE